MKQALFYVLFFLIGCATGGIALWVNSYRPIPLQNPNPVTLAQVFRHANVQITPENFSCVGDTEKTVAAVLSSIYEANDRLTRNMASFGCYGSRCSISITECRPWKSQECGTRLLYFETTAASEINTDSFACIDMP